MVKCNKFHSSLVMQHGWSLLERLELAGCLPPQHCTKYWLDSTTPPLSTPPPPIDMQLQCDACTLAFCKHGKG